MMMLLVQHQLLELLLLLLQVLLQLLVLLPPLGPSQQPLVSLVPGQAQQHCLWPVQLFSFPASSAPSP
jgi:hypothetical protein